MRLLLPFLLSLALVTASQAQDLPAIGTAETFDVATWNVEHFGNSSSGPSNEALQLQNAAAVIRQAEIDLWAVQEMDYANAFNELVAELSAPYAGIRVEDETSFPIGYGFIYNTDVLQVLQTSTILEDYSEEFAYRPPLLLRAALTLPDTVLEVRFIVLHAKAGGTVGDWQRRSQASAALKSYVDNLLSADIPVLVLGDFNDELRSSIASGRPSPYQNFRDDPDAYSFASYPLDLANLATWCSNLTCTAGSTLDHILVTRPLMDNFIQGSMNRYEEVLAAIPQYVNNTSDHLPVYARFEFVPKPTADEPAATPTVFALQAPYPNPFRTATTLTYSLPEAAPVRLEIFDALGRQVATVEDGMRPAGTHTVRFDAKAGLAPGLYLVRLAAGPQTATRRLVYTP